MLSYRDSPPGGQSGIIALAAPLTTVLLVDDDAGFREIARQSLTEDGYAVTEAADGEQALELLSVMVDARLPLPEVLVLDFVMPRLSGLGVLQALRRVPRLPPALLLTSFLDSSVDVFARKLGVARVLRKPIDAEDLCAAVGEIAAQPTPAKLGRARAI